MGNMKEWPDDEHPVENVEDLIAPLRKAAVKLLNRSRRGVEYEGYDTPSVAHIVPTPAEQLSKEGMEQHREQGRDALDVILFIAFHLGYEQGTRVQSSETRRWKKIAEWANFAIAVQDGKIRTATKDKPDGR
jgi:hypothetical protein